MKMARALLTFAKAPDTNSAATEKLDKSNTQQLKINHHHTTIPVFSEVKKVHQYLAGGDSQDEENTNGSRFDDLLTLFAIFSRRLYLFLFEWLVSFQDYTVREVGLHDGQALLDPTSIETSATSVQASDGESNCKCDLDLLANRFLFEERGFALLTNPDSDCRCEIEMSDVRNVNVDSDTVDTHSGSQSDRVDSNKDDMGSVPTVQTWSIRNVDSPISEVISGELTYRQTCRYRPGEIHRLRHWDCAACRAADAVASTGENRPTDPDNDDSQDYVGGVSNPLIGIEKEWLNPGVARLGPLKRFAYEEAQVLL